MLQEQEYLETEFSGSVVYLPIIKQTKLYFITKEYPRLSIVGDTLNDRTQGIKRWKREISKPVRFSKERIAEKTNVMD